MAHHLEDEVAVLLVWVGVLVTAAAVLVRPLDVQQRRARVISKHLVLRAAHEVLLKHQDGSVMFWPRRQGSARQKVLHHAKT